MKAKLKSAGKFAGFMLAHGEKLGMGAVLVVAGMLIWSSLGRDQLSADQAPDKLQAAAASATSHVQGMNIADFPPDEKITASEILVSVNPEAPVVKPDDNWQIRNPNPPPTNPASKRTDPELLAVEEVEVSPGSGIWASADRLVLRERRLKALKEEQEEARAAAEEAERLAAEADGRGRGRGRGRGEGDGGFGGGMGDGMTTKDGAMVIRPVSGTPLQGDEDLQNHSWVIVKAKVPIRAQVKMYDDALATARGYSPTTDQPQYKGYQVQRAEVTDAGDGEWVNLPNVVPDTLIRQMETWPIQTPDEFVSPRYNHPLLTFPLPPMVLRGWDASVTHSELPLPPPDDMMMGEGEGPGRGGSGRDSDGDQGSGDEFQDATQQPAGFAPGGMGEFGGGRGGTDMGGRGGGLGGRGGYGGGTDGGRGGGFGGRSGFGGEGGRGVSSGMMGGAGAYDTTEFENVPWDGQTKYWLFRYFDSDVEPGKRYKYRVRLVVQDVNAAPIQEMYLDNSVIERRVKNVDKKGVPLTYRLTDWSEPSPVAVVPQAGLVFVAGAKPANPTNFSDEPEAEMLIKSLDKGSAAEVAVADYFTRGTVLNLTQQAKIIWSATFETTDKQGVPVSSPAYDFRSGLTLLDFEGGAALNGNRDLTAPARAMVMDSAGRMWIKAELDDEKPVIEYDAYVEQAAEAARQAAQNGNNGGGRGGGGRGGFGGGGGRGGGGRGGGGGRNRGG